MIDKKCNGARCLIALSLMIMSASLHAQERNYAVEFEAGVSNTDNIERTPDTDTDPATDETIYQGGVHFLFVQDAYRWNADVRGSVMRYVYDNQTFDDETLSTLIGNLSFDLVEDRFDWFFRVNHGQQIINPFQPVTPGNREDVTILSTGPNFSIPLGVRTFLTASASYTDLSYETRPLDNERLGGAIGLERDISAEKTVSLNLSSDRIEYEFGNLVAPIERYNAYLGYDIDDARNDLSLSLGWNRIEQAGKEADGFLLELDWVRELSALATLSLNAGTQYSADGDVFRLNQGLDEDFRGTQDVQSVGDPFRHDYAAIGYTFGATRTRVSANIRWDQESYESTSALDRTLGGASLSVRREFTRTLNGQVFVRANNRDYDNATRTDDDLGYGLVFGWNLMRKITLQLRLERIERDTSQAGGDYTENRGTLSFHFTPVKSS